ncbi:MAG: hypothetical protein D6705_15060 [Deltaproteobacteria bacterium]|nr:MAG: hypothetical protein D6705_15060 [Deltaproteobacteria bacterium]
MRTHVSRLVVALSLGATLLPGCALDEGGRTRETTGGGLDPVPPPDADDQDAAFSEAAEAYDVPEILLRAIAEVETGSEFVTGSVEFDEVEPAFGVMALRGERLEEAAAEAGFTPDEVRTDVRANVMGAAALLDAWADEEGVTERGDVFEWIPVVGRYSGIEDPEGRDYYVYMEVLRTVADMLDVDAATLPTPVTDRFDPQVAPGPDYAAAIWRPSPNYSSRPPGSAGDPTFVIIHTCEGSYSGCWSWLKNSKSGVSAHYVVNNTGSEITQLVREAKKAWHISAKYDCSRNAGVECGRNGASSNNFTIGIEHAGYANQSSWHDGLIGASAKLVCDITEDNQIPLDKYHVVGHGQLHPWNRIDPGPNWPWASYLALAESYCGGNQQPDPQPDPDPIPGGSCVHSFGGVYGHGACSAAYQCCDGAWKATQGTCGACTCTEPSGQTGCSGQADPDPDPDPNQDPGDPHAGLSQDGMEIPRAGLANPTLESALGIAVEPYGDVIVDDGKSWVAGRSSWFGGPNDNGVGPTETGAITGEILRQLNDPVNPSKADLDARPEDFYYVAMRWNYGPNGKSWWKDARIVVRNPATGTQVVVRPVDWGPHTSTQRIVDLSPQAMTDLGASTDDVLHVAFAAPGTPLGVVGQAAPDPQPDPDPDPQPQPGPIEIVVDSHDANNGPDASFEASSDWYDAGGPTQYGSGYLWHSTWPESDPATFAFHLDAPATLVVEAWWTSGSNRSTTAPYVITDADGNVLDTVYVDQSKNGGSWQVLGTYDFTAGWNEVMLSVWTTKGKVVVADAVRVRSP